MSSLSVGREIALLSAESELEVSAYRSLVETDVAIGGAAATSDAADELTGVSAHLQTLVGRFRC